MSVRGAKVHWALVPTCWKFTSGKYDKYSNIIFIWCQIFCMKYFCESPCEICEPPLHELQGLSCSWCTGIYHTVQIFFFFFFILIAFLLHVVYHVLTSIQNDIYVIEALTQLHQRHFQMHILWKWLCICFNFTEFCSFGCNWWWVIIDSGNGLVPNRHQAITWTNNDTIHGRISASPGLNKLIHEVLFWSCMT